MGQLPGLAAVFFQLPPTEIEQNRPQPSAEGEFGIVRPPGGEHGQEGFLHHILGPGRIAQFAARHANQGQAVALHEDIEFLEIPLL